MAQHLMVDGARIEYEERGTGTPVVCVHGYLMGGDLWSELADRLASRGYRVITPTWPLGAHRHALPADASRGALAEAARVAAFLEALDLRDVVLVGNDTGGALCQLVAAHHPERVARLVLTNCDVFENFPPSFFKVLLPLARSRRLFDLLVRTLQVRVIRDSPLGFGLLAHADIAGLTAGWAQPMRQDRDVREDTRLLTRGLRHEVLTAATEGMQGFDRPVLVAWGTDDRLFPTDDAERLVATFPHATLELVPESRTFVMVDQPARLADLISAFAPVAA